ncbi:MAG: GNAT family N-acetyltransferase [Verrucomicrobium sp.]|nr:GNAT family N-acetyltransferase [Verrucomicrobium sp.]
MNLAHLPAGLVVREFQPEDRDACVAIYASNEEFLPPGMSESFGHWLDLGTSYLLVIEQAGEVVACGGLEIDGDKNANGAHYGLVRKDRHRLGLGTLLTLTRLALVPSDHDPAFVGLETSIRTEPFYQRFGFERLNKPVSRYAGASYFVDMGLWLPAKQKEELIKTVQALPVEFQLDFYEGAGVGEVGVGDE